MNGHLSLGLQHLGKGVSDSSTLGYKREMPSPIPCSIFPLEAAILGLLCLEKILTRSRLLAEGSLRSLDFVKNFISILCQGCALILKQQKRFKHIFVCFKMGIF